MLTESMLELSGVNFHSRLSSPGAAASSKLVFRQCLGQHSLGGGHAFARLDMIAHFHEHQLDACQSGQDIELIDVAHVSETNDLAFEVILPPGQLDAVL